MKQYITSETAYLFTHFVGREEYPESEQIYQSISHDGIKWEIINNGKCVLKSNVGEKGVRDPFCIRMENGSGFCIIATDLSIHNRIQNSPDKKDIWLNSRTRLGSNPNPGSRNIVVWKSKDLIHWSDAQNIEIAPPDAGCAWAPKAIYDREKNMYLVVWASTIPDDDYKFHRIFKAYTKDFVNFTEPEIWMDRSADELTVIDVAIITDNKFYYRIFKSNGIRMEKSDRLDGEWIPVDSNISTIANKHEGAAIYYNLHTNTWDLLLDSLNKEEIGRAHV